MPHIRIVPSSLLTAEDLRASGYVPNPRRAAKELVDRWAAENPLLRRNSKPLQDLQARVEEALREALETP